jgi:thiosulfate/3-mercaptopyruvate sulfurtransferase
LPTPEAFAEAMGSLGIGNTDQVVAYDDAGGMFAARLVWMLRAIGHRAALLDGGLAAWDGPLEAGPGHLRTPVIFTPVRWPADRVASLEQAGDPATVLIDARARARYRGDLEPVDPRPGHIPGAINVPCEEHLAGGTLLPHDTLRAQFEAAGITSADGVIASCGSGVNACHTLLVMEHAGLGKGRLFPGSYSAWSNRPELPVEGGS